MNQFHRATLTVFAAAVLSACSSVPASNSLLDQARIDYRNAQASTQTQTLASTELKLAADALARAEAAYARRDDTTQVNQLAYLARQSVALAQETASRKVAETTVAEAAATRDQLRLAARTSEADAAGQTAAVAKRDATASQQQAEAAQRQSASSQQQAAMSQQQATAAQQQAGDAERRNAMLETQLRDLNAKKTERGMVITIGDVLFDTNQAQLKSGSLRNIERLGGFLKAYPQRKAAIEGYTDSTGSDSLNLALSGRRADAVGTAQQGMGGAGSQVGAQGYGETHPVAGNDSAGGRQMNRRVEIVLSDDSGVIAPR